VYVYVYKCICVYVRYVRYIGYMVYGMKYKTHLLSMVYSGLHTDVITLSVSALVVGSPCRVCACVFVYVCISQKYIVYSI
jgi:hypothetical protein